MAVHSPKCACPKCQFTEPEARDFCLRGTHYDVDCVEFRNGHWTVLFTSRRSGRNKYHGRISLARWQRAWQEAKYDEIT